MKRLAVDSPSLAAVVSQPNVVPANTREERDMNPLQPTPMWLNVLHVVLIVITAILLVVVGPVFVACALVTRCEIIEDSINDQPMREACEHMCMCHVCVICSNTGRASGPTMSRERIISLIAGHRFPPRSRETRTDRRGPRSP